MWGSLRIEVRLRVVLDVAKTDGRIARVMSLGWVQDHLSGTLLHRGAGHHGRCVERDRLSDGRVLLELFLAIFIGGLLVDTELLVAVGAHRSPSQVQNLLLVRLRVVLIVLWHDGNLSLHPIHYVVVRIIVKLELAHPN